MNTNGLDPAMTTRLQSPLFELARHQDDAAADELAATPYWCASPTPAAGHRTAAAALRAEADLMLAATW